MPFNFIAHHSCRHCSGHLLYSDGKCYGEEEGGGEVKERTCRGVSLESSLGTGRECGRTAPVPQGATSRKENSGAARVGGRPQTRTRNAHCGCNSDLEFEVC